MTLYLHNNTLYASPTTCWNPADRSWVPCEAVDTAAMQAVSPEEALRWMQKESGSPLRPPLGVIGPREATAQQLAVALQVGRDVAYMGITVLCGGRQGVMEATCKGVAENNGISVGLLPEGDWQSGNPYVTVPVATGIGIARNALISRAAVAVVAIGGGLGTISEIALSLQFGKRVFTLCNAPTVEGATAYPNWETLRPQLCLYLLGLTENRA